MKAWQANVIIVLLGQIWFAIIIIGHDVLKILERLR